MRIVASAGARSGNERERDVFAVVGASEMRCVFSPFGLGMQPTLMLCGAAGGAVTVAGATAARQGRKATTGEAVGSIRTLGPTERAAEKATKPPRPVDTQKK